MPDTDQLPQSDNDTASNITSTPASFQDPSLFNNRELSLLAFNERVLAQAENTDTPLLERLKFLCISSTNLDEFFEVRVAGLLQKIESASARAEADGMSANEVLDAVSERAHRLVNKQYRVLNKTLMPALEEAGIRFLRRSEWNESQRAWLADYFQTELLPIISPLGLDPAHPFPRILNKSLNFIVELEGQDAFGRNIDYAVVQAPRVLRRVIQLPSHLDDTGEHDQVFLSSIIHAHVGELFPHLEPAGCYQFRVTRNSELFVDEEETDDLLRAIEGELPTRRYGDAVRLEVAQNCPRHLINYLLEHFRLNNNALYEVDGPVNLNRLMSIVDAVDKPGMKFPPFTPNVDSELGSGADPFGTIRKRDVLLHHPFDSFAPVLDLLRRAATDPQVLAIKQTLYRTGNESVVVDRLAEAANKGKEVTVVIELRARFDEADNIELANELQEAGAHVVYGVVGYKTHAKMLQIVRREADGLRHYVHLGTGNYHPKTARLYTDYGLMTADPVIGRDVHAIFLQLTSLGRTGPLEALLHAPFTLHTAMLNYIGQEAQNAQHGRPARIIAKMNSLVEPEVIRALYNASQSGVEIDLIVRGLCCLRPELPGVSENIRVRSIVGRFLEHTRVFYFENNGTQTLFLSSADWMERNFFRRMETCFPIRDDKIHARVLSDLNTYLADTADAWRLNSDGVYEQVKPAKGESPLSAQYALMPSET